MLSGSGAKALSAKILCLYLLALTHRGYEHICNIAPVFIGNRGHKQDSERLICGFRKQLRCNSNGSSPVLCIQSRITNSVVPDKIFYKDFIGDAAALTLLSHWIPARSMLE